MTAVNRTTLYSYFLTGSRPSQQQFANLIDSTLNIVDASGQAILSDVSALGSFAVSGAFEARSGAVFRSDVNVSGNIAVTGSLSTTNQTISGTTSAQSIKADGSLTVLGQTTLSSAKCRTPAIGDASTDVVNTAYVNSSFLVSANGFRTNTDGTIEQWGSFITSAGGYSQITFPTPFFTSLYSATGNVLSSTNTNLGVNFDTSSVTLSTIPVAAVATDGSYRASSISYRLIGK